MIIWEPLDEIYRLVGTDRGLLTSLSPPTLASTQFYQDWTLDGLGNFATLDDDGTTQSRSVDQANEITGVSGSAGWVTPEYDKAGNMISGPKPGDETTRLHFTYDAWNRLTTVYADDGYDGQGDLLAYYVYDGLNRRVEKVVTAAGGGEAFLQYYYDENWQVLEEQFLDPQYCTTIATNQYLWDVSYIDAPVVRFPSVFSVSPW
jgi:hypothetical protein